MIDFKEDPLFKQVRQLFFRFSSRYSLELDEGESMIHFVFLITMSVLPESAFDEYSLIRGRRSAVSLADTFILENVVLYYLPINLNLLLRKPWLTIFTNSWKTVFLKENWKFLIVYLGKRTAII